MGIINVDRIINKNWKDSDIKALSIYQISYKIVISELQDGRDFLHCCIILILSLYHIQLTMDENHNKSSSHPSFQYITSHPKYHNFLIYSLSSACFGMMLTCLGPMFPYLAVA
jgi:hypothetical protein